MKKKCKRCWISKNTSLFWKSIKTLDWFSAECKKCLKNKKRKLNRTKKWLTTVIYDNQRGAARRRGYEFPNYSRQELREWMFTHKDFDRLYDNRVDSWYDSDLSPSIDRLNDYKPYSLDNIQLITRWENNKKHHEDRKKWLNNKMNTAVKKLSLEWEFIEEYFSMAEAARVNNFSWASHICQCCKWKRASVWWYNREYA